MALEFLDFDFETDLAVDSNFNRVPDFLPAEGIPHFELDPNAGGGLIFTNQSAPGTGAASTAPSIVSSFFNSLVPISQAVVNVAQATTQNASRINPTTLPRGYTVNGGIPVQSGSYVPGYTQPVPGFLSTKPAGSTPAATSMNWTPILLAGAAVLGFMALRGARA